MAWDLFIAKILTISMITMLSTRAIIVMSLRFLNRSKDKDE